MKRKLLSVLLTLCLAFSLLPTAALADGEGTQTNDVAQIGETKYATLQEAVNAANDNTVKLLENVTEDINIPTGINVTLDLNGHKITNVSGHTITVEKGGKLNISDSVGTGVVDNTSHGKGAIVNSGEVTLNGGTFKRSAEKGTYSPYGNGGNSWYTIANYGTMEINTGVTVENAGGYSSMIRNGGEATADCNLTIRGGNFVGGVNTVKNDYFGVLTINGGNFSNTAQYVIMNWNKAEITAGTFRTLDTASAVLFTSAFGGNANYVGKLTISGGEFKHASDTQEMIVDHYDESNKGNAVVTGGKFDADISKYIPTDYVQSADGTVEKLGETNAVAKVDDTYYKTLAAAVAALPYNTDNTAPAATTTIKLLCDTNGGFDFGDGPSKVVNASLDLNNNTLTLGPAIGSTNTETNGIRVLAYSKLEIKNGTIKCSDEVSNNGRKVKVGLANYGTAVLEDIVFKSGTYDIWTVNNRGDLTLKGNTTVETGTNSDTTDNPTLTRAAINNTPYDYFYDGVNAVINVADATVEVGKIVLNDETISASINTNGKAVLNLSAGTFGEISETKPGNGIEGNITGGKFSSDPSVYVVGNGNTNIVKRDGSEGAYTYTVLAKSGLTSGVYLTDPSGALASNYYVSSTANGVWTVSYSAPYSGGSSSYDPTYSVSTPSKTENGSVTVSPKNASKGDRVTVTVKPDSGYVLETLTVTDKNGNELTLKDKGNGKYTFTMPAGKVEVKATFMEDNSMLNFFYDVPNNAYFYEAVKWAVENGITTGVGNNLFAPEQPCTRAQIVTFLWRAAGSPEPKGAASGMTDVVSGSYYEKAVAWAIENGITTGTTTTTFSPDATCTRAQAVTFLARALKAKAASAAEFSDVPTGSYFADAVAWAAANGVTEGIGGGLFGSDNDCTRGQIVTFLYRAYNK